MTLKLTAIGNITRDSELKQIGSSEVLNFSIARNDRRTKEVTYIECAVWGKLASSLHPWAKKGQQVYVEGELTSREYQGRTYLGCRIRDIELLGSNPKQRANDGQNDDPVRETDQSSTNPNSDLDDEIPF